MTTCPITMPSSPLPKAAVAETYLNTGTAPVNREDAGMSPNASDTFGKYVSEVEVANGVITITYDGGDVNQAISGNTVELIPYTSDDGFAVTDYLAVDSGLGAWEDIGRIASQFRLMSDLVLNHCSSQGKWFNAYRQGHEPWDRYFCEASPDDDLSLVVRPRAHPHHSANAAPRVPEPAPPPAPSGRSSP